MPKSPIFTSPLFDRNIFGDFKSKQSLIDGSKMKVKSKLMKYYKHLRKGLEIDFVINLCNNQSFEINLLII